MALIKVSTAPIPTDREDLFEIDGVAYSIPVEVHGSMALEAMRLTREKGEVWATDWVMEQMIGAEGYKALIKCKTATKAEVTAIQKVIREKVFGEQEEEGKG